MGKEKISNMPIAAIADADFLPFVKSIGLDVFSNNRISFASLKESIGALTGAAIIDALGYTPYNDANPAGYITSAALANYATQSWVNAQGYITGTPWTGMGYITGTAVASAYVPYTGATGAVNLGSNFLYAGRIGIGTTSPTEALEVSGNIKFTNSGNQLRNYAGNTILNDTGNVITIGNAVTTAQYLPYGSVGIGISSGVNARLHIQGKSAITGTAFLVQSSTPTELFSIANNCQVKIGPAAYSHPTQTIFQVSDSSSTILLSLDTTFIQLPNLVTNTGATGLTVSGNAYLILKPTNGNNGYVTIGDNSINSIAYNNSTRNFVTLNQDWLAVTGSSNLNITALRLTNSINMALSTGTNIVKGILVNQALTGPMDYRAIEAITGNNSAHTLLKLNNGAVDVLLVKGDNKIGMFGATPVAQATGGAATATVVWTAAEKLMLQKVYDAVRGIGILS